MKRLILAISLLCFASTCFAAMQLVAEKSFTASSSTTYVDVKNYRTKSMAVTGYNAAGVFNNMSGTYSIKACTSNTGAGYCAVVAQQDGTTATGTTNAIFSWDDAFPYLQIVWTKTKNNVKFWIYGNQY